MLNFTSVLFYSLSLFCCRSDGFIIRRARATEKRHELTLKLKITTKIMSSVKWDRQVSKNFKVIDFVLALC